ncbi:MAG: Bax inhibitor-1/YccA family protein [Candidatus Gracilibacteria bacterium]
MNTTQDFTYDEQDGLSAVRTSSFLSKVLFFFGLAVAISAAGTFTGFQYLGPLFLENPNLMWVFFAVELVLVISARWWSTKRPLNYLLFAAFSFITGVTIVPLLASIIIEFGGPGIIIKAFLATTLTFTSAAIIGATSQRSFSGLGGFLTIALVGMIIVSLVGIFVPWSNTFEMIFSGIGVLIFTGYTLYDVQKLKHYPTDRYIDAALQLYLDIFNLFLYILRLIAGISRSK